MNGEVAQLLAVAAHGTAALVRGGPHPELTGANSTFRHVAEAVLEPPRGGRTAAGTAAWFAALADEGVARLVADARERLVWTQPAGAAWAPAWSYRGGDDRPWTVAYRRTSAEALPPSSDVDGASRALLRALEDAHRLAQAHDLAPFDDHLRDALALFDEATPATPCHPDILPPDPGWPAEARRLLAVAVRAWVFGGMGSWNDLGTPPGVAARDFDAVTEALYEGVLAGLSAAVNAFSVASAGSSTSPP